MEYKKFIEEAKQKAKEIEQDTALMIKGILMEFGKESVDLDLTLSCLCEDEVMDVHMKRVDLNDGQWLVLYDDEGEDWFLGNLMPGEALVLLQELAIMLNTLA